MEVSSNSTGLPESNLPLLIISHTFIISRIQRIFLLRDLFDDQLDYLSQCPDQQPNPFQYSSHTQMQIIACTPTLPSKVSTLLFVLSNVPFSLDVLPLESHDISLERVDFGS